MPSIDQIQKQLVDFVTGLSWKQRGLMLGATVLTVAVLFAFVHLISTPDFKPLVTDMEPADAQALATKLAAKSIPYQLSPDGKTVSVPSDQLDTSRMEVASDGMPRSGRLGFELFDKMNWGQTEFDEKVNYQRALEGELERSIQTLNGVESARVHLVMPADSVFLDRERAAKASVVLKLRSGRLSQDTQLSIARLVSGAVDNLSPDNVTVIDADTNQPMGSHHQGGVGVDGDLEQNLTAHLLQTLEPVVGAQHIRASVNVDYDPSTGEENSETYDPKSAVAVATQSSDEQIGGALTGGVPGTSSNVPSGNTTTKSAIVQGGDSSQISKSESNTYAVNKVVRHVLEPAGRVRRITAALLVDDAVDVKQVNGKSVETRRKRTPEELKQIEELAKAAIGIDSTRGDVITVQNLSFEQPPIEALAKPSITEKVRVGLNNWSSIVRYAALLGLFLLAYFLLLRPMKKQLMTTLKELPARVTNAQKLEASQRESFGEVSSLPPDQQRSMAIKKQLIEKAKGEPMATSRLIQGWIHEGGK
ncbi:MAG TPA: flagellar basal-body MS-ring/collar protein FliF [Terriglobales bacterium]|jgi:flagellar M-ring protein FliF